MGMEITKNFWIAVGLIGISIAGYFYYYAPHQKCSTKIEYHPANTDRVRDVGMYSDERVHNSEYYSYNYTSFKTKEDAINYCMNKL